MSLSDKIHGFGISRRKVKKGFVWEEDLKQSIKRLKEDIFKTDTVNEIRNKIDKEFGDKLI